MLDSNTFLCLRILSGVWLIQQRVFHITIIVYFCDWMFPQSSKKPH